MPLELGMFLGAKRYGRSEQKRKNCLILDVERYRYHKFISDIAGQDISAHAAEPSRAIKIVRDWLSNLTPVSLVLPGGGASPRVSEVFRLTCLHRAANWT
jgi:hypothetical protein